VLADSPNLERALLHLLANAVKFTPDGGKVRLRARSYGDELEIEVSDTGIGIPQDELATLFAPFARGREAQDQAFPGFGVGLAVVKGLVDAHGGRVSVRSKPGRGTTVTVRLPATRGADEDQSQNA
jgi:signal transduction histidine kinase